MKKQRILLMAAFAFGAVCGTIQAQDNPPPGPPPGDAGVSKPEGKGGKLTPEQREKVKAAMLKANSDPQVQASRDDMKAALEDLKTVMDKAILAQDPSLAPTLQKVEKSRAGHREKMKGKFKGQRAEGGGPGEAGPPEGPGGGPDRGGFRKEGGPGERGPGPMMGDLDQAERDKLRAAHEKVKDNPEVKTARERVEKSRTTSREAMRAALIAADPSLAPIVEEVLARSERPMDGPGMHKQRRPKGEKK